MARPTDQERLKKSDKKIEQTKAKKELLQRRIKQGKRKARTKRLIEVGAIFENYIVGEGQDNELY